MNRLLLAAAIFLGVLVIALLIVGYFAYVIESGPPEHAEVFGLDNPVTVRWTSTQVASVEASATRDALAGLGYAQASRRAWPMLLYRAAALGNLFDLMGEEALEADETAIRLGLGDGARRAFDALTDDQQQFLESFAAGVNAALSDDRILRDPALLLSGVRPQPWEPWHSIAVERLFAWLGAEAETASTLLQRRPIREVLRLHDFQHSFAVASLPPIERGLYVRYVFGSSSLPVLFEVTASGLFDNDLQGACLVGTPFFLAGRTVDRAWAFLPHSRYSVRRVADSARLKIGRKRLGVVKGTERVTTILTDSLGVVLGLEIPTPDMLSDSTQHIVSWSGLGAVSDVSAWLNVISAPVDIASAPTPNFFLFDGSGIVLSPDRELYASRGVRRSPHFSSVGETIWSGSAMQRLDSLASEAQGFYPRLWFLDTYSPWASRTTKMLVAALDSIEAERVPEAATYLRNWEYDFSRASIAASVFSVWTEIARANEGHWPGLPGAARRDTAAAARPLTPRHERWANYLDVAVSRMTTEFGTDMSTWRWERVNSGELHFPLLGGTDTGPSRFSPTIVSGFGHASSPAWGPPAVSDVRKPMNVWEGWTRMAAADAWQVRRLLTETTGFSGSSARGELRHLAAVGDAQAGAAKITTLHPMND